MSKTTFITASFCKSATLLACAMLSVGVSQGNAQVFDSGPSDSALFDTVINLPPVPNIGDNESIGGDGLTTQLNLADGGSVGASFDADSSCEMNISGGTVSDCLRIGDFFSPGGEVNISGGTIGNDFTARGGEVNISGGTVGAGFSPIGGVVNISGGSVGEELLSNGGAVINISGGTVGGNFAAQSSVVNISGGVVGDAFFVRASNVVNISGGTIGDNFFAAAGNEVNISGGIFGNGFGIGSSNQLHLFGSEFILDGVPMGGLMPDQAFTITDRDVTLSGLLTDGSAFSFDLNSFVVFGSGEDRFDPNATLTVTLGAPLLLGDVDQNGTIDFLDISPFISLLSNGEFQGEADINRNGFVDFLDIAPLIEILSGN